MARAAKLPHPRDRRIVMCVNGVGRSTSLTMAECSDCFQYVMWACLVCQRVLVGRSRVRISRGS